MDNTLNLSGMQVDEKKLAEAFQADRALLNAWLPRGFSVNDKGVLQRPKYIPYIPKKKQWAFLMYNGRECLLGGEPGGGKSAGLLMAALQYVDVPGYACVVFRRNLGDLTKPGGVKWLADQWLAPWAKKDVFWDEANFQYKFANPGGYSYLQFAHMQYEKDKYRMRGSAYQRILFDELTEFTFGMYTYAFRSLRPSSELSVPIPVGMRSTTNPGGEGEDWVVERFNIFEPDDVKRGELNGPDKLFIEITTADGALNAQAYRKVLEEMEPIERERLLNARWGLKDSGMIFKRENFKIVNSDLDGIVERCRSWDLSASKKTSKHGHSADFTVGQLWGRSVADEIICEDQVRGRWGTEEGDSWIARTAERDGHDVMIVLPQEPGQAGLRLRAHYEKLLRGYPLTFYTQSQSKKLRAHPYAYHAGKNGAYLLESDWNQNFIDEHVLFTGMPSSAKDDCVDTASLAFRYLMEGALVQVRSTAVVEPWQSEKAEREPSPWDTAASPMENFGGENEYDG